MFLYKSCNLLCNNTYGRWNLEENELQLLEVGNKIPKHYIPSHVTTFFMNFHLEALELIQFFSNGSLVLRGQSSPWLICSSIVIMCRGNFNVIIETDDLSGLQLFDSRSETQLSNMRNKDKNKG